MIIDTHCHLDFKDFDRDRDSVLARAKEKGVARIINVGSSLEGTRRAIELSKKYDIVYASVGIHPHDADSVTDKVFDELKILVIHNSRAPFRLRQGFGGQVKVPYDGGQGKVVAIGEVGLDYYRNLSPKESQKTAFRKFISLAQELDLPLIVHSREADDDVVNILKEYERRIRGVIHCFSGSEEMLKNCLDLGFYISFTCNLTFKNAKDLRVLAKTVPMERILLETDAPYLAPEGLRGKRNEPAYLEYLVEEWSKISGLTKDDIERITTHNANKLFKLGLDEERSKIAYEIRDSLYLNITNQCTNNCDFCIRQETAFVKGHNLKLERDPSVTEIIGAIGDPKKYREIVFCGYGEPTTRLDVVKAVAGELKKKGALIRLVTNGHGDLINSKAIAKELAGLVDRVSVSLNVDGKDRYNKICRPKFGAGAYNAVLEFVKSCVANGIAAEVTCLDLKGVDVKECERIARNLGADFRLRKYGVTG